jgi:hypothetical protein
MIYRDVALLAVSIFLVGSPDNSFDLFPAQNGSFLYPILVVAMSIHFLLLSVLVFRAFELTDDERAVQDFLKARKRTA